MSLRWHARAVRNPKAKAALNPIYGAEKVTRFLAGVMSKFRPKNGFEVILVEMNGMPGFVLQEDGALHSALTVEFDGDTMSALYFVRNPDKLRHLGPVSRIWHLRQEE